MLIILKNIPANANNIKIEEFIRPAVKGGLFSKSGYIKNISIIVKKDIKTHITKHHGVVTIEPDFVAKRTIKKLNGKRMNGRCVAITEYVNRSWHNDPRMNPIVKKYHDNRKHDRRCQSVYVELKPTEELIGEECIVSFNSERIYYEKYNAN